MTGNPAFQKEFFGGLARLVPCRAHADERGILTPFAFDQLPFTPCRSFVVTNAPAGCVRGGHAHRSGMQMLVCLQGSIQVVMRHDGQEVDLKLEPGSHGLAFGPGVWCQQRYVEDGSVLLVFASEPYDPESYIEESD
jgi:dTDP-4-dehydrorhamnose 3,5-epimerase-like enzyme